MCFLVLIKKISNISSNFFFLTFQQRIGKTSSIYMDYNKLNPGNLSLIIIDISNCIPVPIYKSDDVRQLKCSDVQQVLNRHVKFAKVCVRLEN